MENYSDKTKYTCNSHTNAIELSYMHFSTVSVSHLALKCPCQNTHQEYQTMTNCDAVGMGNAKGLGTLEG